MGSKTNSNVPNLKHHNLNIFSLQPFFVFFLLSHTFLHGGDVLMGKGGGIRWFRRGLVICIQLFHQSHIFLRTKLTAFPPRRPLSEGTFKQSFYSDLYFCLIISSSYRNPSASAVERVFFPFLKCCRIKTTAMRRENNKYLFSHSHLRG